jgi:hypothetical protein
MTTTPHPPAAAGAAAAAPVAVAVVAVKTIREDVALAHQDPAARHALKQKMAAIHRVANGMDNGRATGPSVGPAQAPLNDVNYDGPDGATVAWRQRMGANGPVREFVGIGANDAAAGEQAAEALGRTPGVAVPGLEAYGDRSEPAATVDDRTTVLDAGAARNGLSTDSPTRATEGAAQAQEQTGSRIPIQPGQDRTR